MLLSAKPGKRLRSSRVTVSPTTFILHQKEFRVPSEIRFSSFRSFRLLRLACWMANDFVSTATGGKSGSLRDALIELFVHVLVTRYLNLIGITLLLYDHILTIPEEISVIWKRKKSPVSWIFLVNRYLVPIIIGIDVYDKTGLSGGLSDNFCKTWTVVEAHLHIISHASIHALVALRVSAIWGHNIYVKWYVGITWVLYFIATLCLGSYGVIHGAHTFIWDATTKVCFGVIPSYLWLVWIPPLILEFELFVLTITRARQQYRTSVKMMPFAQILYRDGAIYFIIITLCSISNVLVWRYAPVSLSGVAKYFTFSIVNVTASRMVLNLRSQGDATSYQSAQDFDYAYFVDAVSQEPIDMDVVRDLEDQRLAQAQTKQIRLANGVMITTTMTVSSDHPRRTATSPTRSSFSGAKLGDQRRRTSFRRASATVQFEMDVLERSLPRAAAQWNPQNRGKSTSLDVVDETPRGTIEVESSSSHSAATDNTKPRSLE